MHQSMKKSDKLDFDLSLSKRFLFLGRNSGIHGLAHLFRENAVFFARLFWFLVLLVSMGAMYLILMSLLEVNSQVSYTADTRYLDWTTNFPAVTVCEKYDSKATRLQLNEFYPEVLAGKSFDFQFHMASLLYNKAVSCRRGVCTPCGEVVPCEFPWRTAIEKVHKPCEDLLKDCYIKDHDTREFPCCRKFYLVDSEYGPCYSFNTQQGEQTGELYYVNRSTGPGALSFRVTAEVEISVHSNEELSTNYLDSKLKFDVPPTSICNRLDYTFSVVDFENHPLLKSDTPDGRGCRYQNEMPKGTFDTYNVYSYGACRTARDTEHTFEHCYCVHPARDLSYSKIYCNFTGLNCLVEYEVQKTKLGLEDTHDDTDPCLPSCSESELTTIHISRRWVKEEPGLGTKVTVQMAGLPTLRFQRELFRTPLELVVSVGGILGVFFGASIFSLLEILYLFLRKP